MSATVATGASRPRLYAFSSSDCHTCMSEKRECERQRPYCSTCLRHGIKCGGYATELSWHQSRTYSGRGRQRRQQAGDQLPLSSRRHRIEDHRKKLRRSGDVRNSPFQESTQGSDLEAVHSQDPEASPAYTYNLLDDNDSPSSINGVAVTPGAAVTCPAENLEYQAQDCLHEVALIPDDQGIILGSLQPEDLDGDQCLAQSHMGEYPLFEDSSFPIDASNLADYTVSDAAINSTYNASLNMLIRLDGRHWDTTKLSNPISVPPSVDISIDPRRQRDILLKCYDTDLCVLPLTCDLASNPFRVRGFEPDVSQLLLKSILALYSQHQVNLGVGRTLEALDHRLRASEALTQELQGGGRENSDQYILAAILILMTLDCTISASGNWSDHINKAAALLESWGGDKALESPRIRSQVGMLVWWDATLALISRKGALLPSSYFHYLVQNEKLDGWSFYHLTGCPTELVILLMQLVEMARQRELACSMEYLTFNMDSVSEVEQKLLSWKNGFAGGRIKLGADEPRDEFPEDLVSVEAESYSSASPAISEEDDEEFCQQQDRYHLAEAWRYALLLYIQRVFRWDRQSHRRPPSVLRLTSSILEHTQNCRKISQAQKQLLLPVFLAGAEARDENMRETVRSFCHWWGAKSRYGMFYSVSNLLEEYWAQSQDRTGNPIWWASFLDEKSSQPKAEAGSVQFLFG